MDTHAINTTDLVIMVVCLTFSNPNVKCVKTVSTTQTVPADVVIAKADMRVIRKMEIVQTVAVQISKCLCAKSASLAFMEKTVTKPVQTAIQVHLVAIDTMATVFLDVKMEGKLLVVNQ